MPDATLATLRVLLAFPDPFPATWPWWLRIAVVAAVVGKLVVLWAVAEGLAHGDGSEPPDPGRPEPDDRDFSGW